ncbi:MAG: hypothetical protein ABW221_01395 [Vicinamibacteria bacterium]
MSLEKDGLILKDPRWVLTGRSPDPALFFGALLDLVPVGVLLFLEGGSRPSELRRLIDLFKVDVALRPALGTRWPRQEYITLRALPAVMEEMARLTARLPVREICSHLHVFDGDRVFLEGYDAFRNPFRLSGFIEERRLEVFCKAIGCGYQELEREWPDQR